MAASLGLLSLVKVLVVPTLPVLCVVIPEIINQRHSYIQILHLIHNKQMHKAEYSCTFIIKYSVHYLIWNICIYAHKDVHIYKKLINKLVELHVNSYFFLNWDGWGLYGLPVPVLLKVSTQYSVVDLCLGLSGCRCVNEAVNEM